MNEQISAITGDPWNKPFHRHADHGWWSHEHSLTFPKPCVAYYFKDQESIQIGGCIYKDPVTGRAISLSPMVPEIVLLDLSDPLFAKEKVIQRIFDTPQEAIVNIEWEWVTFC